MPPATYFRLWKVVSLVQRVFNPDADISHLQGSPVQAVDDLAILTYDLADHLPDSFLVLLGDIYYQEAGPVA